MGDAWECTKQGSIHTSFQLFCNNGTAPIAYSFCPRSIVTPEDDSQGILPLLGACLQRKGVPCGRCRALLALQSTDRNDVVRFGNDVT